MAGTAFVGRRGELERLGRALRGDPGAGSVAVVTGDAGIGKTRLLAEALRGVPEVLVLAGACLPLSESLPYGAVTDALADLASPDGRPLLDRALKLCAPYVQHQMTALIPSLADEPRGAADSAADRTRLFASVRDLLAALGSERRTAVVVEDVHWADSGTLDLLTFLVRGHLLAGTALVLTSRRDELPAYDPILRWLASTLRVPGIEHLALDALSDQDVEALIASLVVAEPAKEFLAEVFRRGEGNPFFTEQLVAAAHDVAPPLEIPAGVPPEVAEMLLGRFRAVSPLATEVASVLAVAARPLAEPELTACAGTHVDVAVGLRELIDAHLVETADGDMYRLRHALLEDTVRGTLLASQRAVLHAGVARVLVARGDESPAEIAAHWSRAGDLGEEARWSVHAARQAEGLFAWREASASWHRVWELWAALAPNDRPSMGLAEVAVAAVVDAERSDDDANLERLLQEALADPRVTADDEATGQLLRRHGQRLALVTGELAASGAAFQRAVAVFEGTGRPSAEHARALLDLGRFKTYFDARTGMGDEEIERATSIAEQVGAVDVLIEIEGDRSVRRLRSGDVEEALRGLSEVWARAQQAGAEHAEVVAAINLSATYVYVLRLPEAIDFGRRAIDRALARGYRDSMEFSLIVVNTLDGLVLSGAVDAAERLVDTYLLSEVTSNGWPLHVARAELDLLVGDVDGALARLEPMETWEGANANDDMGMRLAEVRAAAELWQGQPASALTRIEATWDVFQDSPEATSGSRLLALAARAAADLCDVNSDADRSGLAQRLRSLAYKAECFTPPARVLGAAYGATFDAELARLQRLGDEARAWQAAKANWTTYEVPQETAYAGWRLTEKLLADGRRKDAEAELAAAYTAAETHVPLRREIEVLARRARLPLPDGRGRSLSPAEAGGASDAEHGLTSRELEVLRLLGTGATNAQIGKRLYMSPKTASVHVSAIIRKLGVSGRVQAATVAERMGLLAGPEGGGDPS